MGQGSVSKNEINILVTGLYDAGKTTLVQKLTGETPQLLAFPSIERCSLRNFIFTSWDVGGRDKMRPLHRHFYPILDAVVFLVDSHELKDPFQRRMVRDQLQALLSEEELPEDLPLLVVANKQDLPGALPCQQVLKELGLELGRTGRQRPVDILPLSLVTGEGLAELRDWLERQHRRRALRTALVEPVQKAVPPAITSAHSKMSSALKQAFGVVKKKLSLVA